MRVLFLDQFSETGGAQRCLLDLVPAALERGWQARALLPGPGPFGAELEARGVPVDVVPFGPYGSGRKSFGDVARFAADLPALVSGINRLARGGLIYVNGPRLLPAAALAAGGRMPVLFHCHSHLGQSYTAWLAGQALRRARATLIASSRFVAQPLLTFASEEKCCVVYNGVAACPPVRERIRRGPWRIGVVGRFAPEKGQAEFVEAARILHSQNLDCRFVICGAPLFPGSGEYAARVECAARGLPVDFLGWREDIAEVFGGLDLVVVPSASVDATPRVILEAYAAGVPVIAFCSGGIPEIVADEETGFLVHPLEPRALAARIGTLIRDTPHRLAEVASNASAAWREKFSLERYQREMLKWMERAAKEGGETGIRK